MALAEPLSMSSGAWRAIGTEVVGPAAGTARADEVRAYAGLEAAWREGREAGGTVTVHLEPAQAGLLAGLLDARPELAAALH